jgi:hypothetical protein
MIETSERLCKGDLVGYLDPVPEDLRIIDDVGVIVECEGAAYYKVKWQKSRKMNIYLRKELKLLARARGLNNSQK